MIVNYRLGENIISLELKGNTVVGSEEVLLAQDENLIENTPWHSTGYSIEPFLTEREFMAIQYGIKDLISNKISESGGSTDANFRLDNYHSYVDNEIHLNLARLIQSGWSVREFPIDINSVNERISEIIGQKVSTIAKHVDMNNFFVRVVRPQNFQDNNPPHRDAWLDRLRDAVNIYVPICGSNEHSALGLIPGSHLLKESQIERTVQGAVLNGTSYTVPCVISINNEMLELIRPNPLENEVLLFSPYLVHGGGYNFNENQTSISLEMRFWKI
jgi:hypothetical protein